MEMLCKDGWMDGLLSSKVGLLLAVVTLCSAGLSDGSIRVHFCLLKYLE
jgi:hypothetical protein